MKKKRKILYLFLVIDLLVVGYLFISSSYLNYQTEKQVYSIAVDYFMGKTNRYFKDKKETVDREIEFFTKKDEKLIEKLKGKILIQIESKGEAWYLNPHDEKKHFLGSPQTAYKQIKDLSISVTEEEISPYLFKNKFPEEYSGKFIYTNKKSNIFYYINPDNLKYHKITKAKDTHEVFKDIGIGITNENIRKIEVAPIKLRNMIY